MAVYIVCVNGNKEHCTPFGRFYPLNVGMNIATMFHPNSAIQMGIYEYAEKKNEKKVEIESRDKEKEWLPVAH